MRPASLLLACMLASCATVRLPMHPAGWSARLQTLQRNDDWDMQGRAAVAAGSRGWQASVDWRQRPTSTVVHLSGPLGVGATLLRLDVGGLSVNGAPPSRAGVAAMQRRLGFDLPVSQLRFWLLGVPDPAAAFSLSFNAQKRVAQLAQSGWTVQFLRYRPYRGDWLPKLLVLRNDGVRVRIFVDRWRGVR